MLGQPETGFWSANDEDAFLDCIEEKASNEWECLASFFPRNWFHLFDSAIY